MNQGHTKCVALVVAIDRPRIADLLRREGGSSVDNSDRVLRGDAPGLEALGHGENVILAKGMLELGERAEREAQAIVLPSRIASISPRFRLTMAASLNVTPQRRS